MTALAEDLKSLLAKLPTADRAEIASFLLESLPDDAPAVSDDEWEAELNRRVQDMKSGAVIPIPASQVLAELRSEFP